MFTYDDLTRRNVGYINPAAQARVRATRLLIAGCGIGSTFAETAVRLGFEHLLLSDGDTVSAHNLNRQDFTASDVGTPKVDALARRLITINPNARLEPVNAFLTPANVAELVSRADLVFDTIDFLDLQGIVALHDEARRQQKPIITALAIGWGAGCMYFPPDSPYTFRKLFGLPETGSVAMESYIQRFSKVIERLASRLDPEVVAVVAKALTVMEDGTPCPASQVAPGAASVGALGATAAFRVITGLPVRPAPQLLILDVVGALTGGGIDLAD